MSSKLSKIYSIKQQKKYRNQTINILNHLNTKITTPTLADKSLNNFKSIKPQVQSSRLNRPQTGKILSKQNCISKQREKYDKEKQRQRQRERGFDLGFGEGYEKISSKSLQSRQGSYNTHRRQSDKTKKNSYSRLKTQPLGIDQNINYSKQQERLYNFIQKRLKSIQNLFFCSKNQDVTSSLYSPNIQNLKIQLKPDLFSIETHLNSYANTNKNTKNLKNNKNNKNNNSTTNIKQNQNLNAAQMIVQLNKKFEKFKQDFSQDNKNRQQYPQFDILLTNIINELHNSFFTILSNLLQQNQQKMFDIQMSITKMLNDHQQQIQKYVNKCDQIKQSYMQQIQGLLIKSLYMNDKINAMQQKCILNFEKQARKLDKNQQQELYEAHNQFIESQCIGEDGQNSNQQVCQESMNSQMLSQDWQFLRKQRQQDIQYFDQFEENNTHSYDKQHYNIPYMINKPQHARDMKKQQNKAIRYGYIHSFR